MKYLGMLVLALGLLAGQAFAQTEPCKPQRHAVNRAGNMSDMTITSAAPVQVVLADTQRCQVQLKNSGSNPMRCAPVGQGLPTSSKGLTFAANDQLVMTTAGREAWNCIATGSSTTATTLEELP